MFDNFTSTRIPITGSHQHLGDGLSVLADRSWVDYGYVFGPMVFTAGIFIAHSFATGMPAEAYGLPEAFFIYALINGLVVGILSRRVDAETWRAIARFQVPTGRELGWTVMAFFAGAILYPLTAAITGALGLPPVTIPYSLSNPPIFVMVAVGVVLILPIIEEILFRGLLFGRLLSRDGDVTPSGRVLLAGAVTTLAYATGYSLAFGVAGLVFVSLWGMLPLVLRIRFDSLTGPVLLHLANNVVAAVVLVGF